MMMFSGWNSCERGKGGAEGACVSEREHGERASCVHHEARRAYHEDVGDADAGHQVCRGLRHDRLALLHLLLLLRHLLLHALGQEPVEEVHLERRGRAEAGRVLEHV